MITIQNYSNYVMDEAAKYGGDWERVLSQEIANAITYGMDVMRDAILEKLETAVDMDVVLDDIRSMVIDEFPESERDEDDPYDGELIDDGLFEDLFDE